MLGNWYHIVKVEYLVMTARFRSQRKAVMMSLFTLSVIWALIIVPTIASILLQWFGAQMEFLLVLGFSESTMDSEEFSQWH